MEPHLENHCPLNSNKLNISKKLDFAKQAVIIQWNYAVSFIRFGSILKWEKYFLIQNIKLKS